jgi:hypothetical protein
LYLASDKICQYFHDYVLNKIAVFRGDSWQFVVSDPSKSLRIGLFYRLLIREGMEAKKSIPASQSVSVRLASFPTTIYPVVMVKHSGFQGKH